MLGVNSDPDRESLKETVAKERISWQSWWDEGSIDGPIHQQWQILLRPAIHLIDPQGVIRYRNLDPDKLDKAIAELMAEVAS